MMDIVWIVVTRIVVMVSIGVVIWGLMTILFNMCNTLHIIPKIYEELIEIHKLLEK